MSAPISGALVLESPVALGRERVLDRPPLHPRADAITLALVGGPRLWREATASLLSAQDGLSVTATYESGAHFLAVGADTPPAVLLLDCDGQDSSSWRATIAALSSAEIESRIAMLCQEVREDAVRGRPS